MINNTDLWSSDLPCPHENSHKYTRGHLIVLGGESMTGAARLVSEAAMRIGCGLCTIISSESSKNIYLSGSPHVMFQSYKNLSDFPVRIASLSSQACVIGPGAGKDHAAELRQVILETLSLKQKTVLDGDALSVFEDKADELFSALHMNCVLTPHEGEFLRIFPKLKGTRKDRVLQAAQKTGAVILLKGAETVISSPAGNIVLNDHATPWLATAGSGDVLAGVVGGLLAQNMEVFKAAAAAAWIHGEAGRKLGPGLISPDLIGEIPGILKSLIL